MIRALLAVIAVVIVVVGGTWLWLRLDQPVRVVRVEGAITNAEQDAIRAVLSEALTDGVLSIDLDELTARIFGLSWPREVRVRRLWPDGLLVQVQREPLVASWGEGEFLTSAGKVVNLPGHQEDALPALSANLSTPLQTMQTYLLLQEQLRASELVIARLAENSLGEWQVTLDNGISVALGNRELSERLQRFLLLYHRVLAERVPEPAHVDTRYENGLAVRQGEPVPEPGTQEDIAPDRAPIAKPETEPMLAFEKARDQQQIESGTRNGF
jgi:cell division protein FtsQ